MHRCLVTSGLAAMWLAVQAPGMQAQEPTLGEGAQVYAATCGRCHNARGPDERSDREWDVIVTHMRTRAMLSGRDARAVARFLQASNPPEAAPVAEAAMGPASAEDGEKLVEKNGCMACHKIGRYTTGVIGPDLNTVLTRRKPDYILKKLADPKTDSPASVMPQMNLSASERQAILEYITSIAQK